MSVLVTGGCGYIGSHTTRLLRELGRDVVVLDNMESGCPHTIADVPLVVGDIADAETVSRLVRLYGVDSVMHFAAHKSAGESMSSPGKYFQNNIANSLVFIERLNYLGIKQVVFSSSCAVYGTPEQVPVDEFAPIHPESPYGESKAAVERILAWYDRCSEFRSISLRYFNAAGAWFDGSIGEDWQLTSNLIPLVLKAALGHERVVRIFGVDYPTADGTAIRDYVHVMDLANAHIKALELLESGAESTAINLGSGKGSSVFEVLATAEQISGCAIPYELAPRRRGDPVALYSDNRRSGELLGWSARFRLDEIIASAWNWHCTHPQGFSNWALSGQLACPDR